MIICPPLSAHQLPPRPVPRADNVLLACVVYVRARTRVVVYRDGFSLGVVFRVRGGGGAGGGGPAALNMTSARGTAFCHPLSVLMEFQSPTVRRLPPPTIFHLLPAPRGPGSLFIRFPPLLSPVPGPRSSRAAHLF